MRQERTVQASIFDVFATHEIGRELQAMSRWLDVHRNLLGLVAGDLVRGVMIVGPPRSVPAKFSSPAAAPIVSNSTAN